MAKAWEHNKASAAGSEADPLAARFVSSLDYDWRLYRHDIAGSMAHAKMLEDVGLLTGEECKKIETGLNEILTEIEALGPNGRQWPGFKVELEDVHMCVEAALTERIGEPARKLHTGRSRNDQVALDLTWWIRTNLWDDLEPRFFSVFKAFFELAQRDGHIVMPSYTHLQRAQPIVVGGELMAWLAALDRAWQRLAALGKQVDTSPLGSGAIAGSALPLDRFKARDHMGLSQVTSNSIDATASRDMAIDFVYGLSMTAMTLSRWAEQWIIYSSTEFGFIQLADAYTTGSSMMPQKQNPDMLELIRGKSGSVYGCLVALLTMCKGLPVGYNRDLQEDKRHVFQAFDDVCDCLDMTAKMVSSVTFNEARIADGLDRGFLDATSLAEYLVTQGVAFRTAHQIVGALVAKCRELGHHKLEQLSVEQMNAEAKAMADSPPFTEAVYDWLGPDKVVQRYQTYGNAGVTGFEQQLADWRQRLSDVDANE